MGGIAPYKSVIGCRNGVCIWLCADGALRNTRQNWKRFSEVPKMGYLGLWKKRKIISCVKKGLISRENCCKLKAWKR